MEEAVGKKEGKDAIEKDDDDDSKSDDNNESDDDDDSKSDDNNESDDDAMATMAAMADCGLLLMSSASLRSTKMVTLRSLMGKMHRPCVAHGR